MAKISKDTPLSEITLRRYERPSEDLTERDIVRKLCLSLGLLQPGDSRDVIVDVLYALLEGKREKIAFTSEEVRDKVSEIRKRHSLPLAGMASSNIRRQLLRLRDLYIAEKNINKYRITEFLSLHETFNEKTEQFMLKQILGRVKEYTKYVDERFK